MPKGQNNPKYEITIPGQEPFGDGCCLEAMEEPENAAVGANLRHTDGEPNGKFAEIHEHVTFLEPRDYEEYVGPTERAPVHLLRILPAEKMKVQLIENSPIANTQATYSILNDPNLLYPTKRKM